MSSDYISWVAWLRPNVSRALLEDELDAEDAPIRAAGGSVVFRPGIDREFRPKAIARAVGNTWPAPADIRVSVTGTSIFSSASTRGVDDDRHGFFVCSSNFPLLPLVDRLVAIPSGVRFMEGKAYARLRPKRRVRLATEWPALMQRLGGEKEVARKLAPYIDRGDDVEHEARAVLSAVTRGIRTAEDKGYDLVLVGANAGR